MPGSDLMHERLHAFLDTRFGTGWTLSPLAQGLETRAFALDSGGTPLVARIGEDRTAFEKDDLAARDFASPALPVPAVIHIGQLTPGLYICISERAPGRTLQELPPQQVQKLAGPVFAAMKAIADTNIETLTGFGPVDSRGHGQYESWRRFICAPLKPGVAKFAGPDRHLAAACLGYVEKGASLCPERRELVHGDFGSNNIIADGARVTAVIDWSEAMIGDSLYDAANILFWRTWLDCMQIQAAHLDRTLPDDLATKGCLLIYQLHIGLRELAATGPSADASFVNWLRIRCGQLLGAAGA